MDRLQEQIVDVLFIMNGIGSVGNLPGVSGGDVRWIEIAKRWQSRGHRIHVLTPAAGKRLCERLGLRATFHIFNVRDEYSLNSYIQRFLKSGCIPRSLRNFEGIVYSTTEHFYDVFPAYKINKMKGNNIWAAVVHWVAPLKRKGTSLLNSTLFFLNQRMGFYYITKGADVVLAVSHNTTKQLRKLGLKANVFSVDAGVDYERIRELSTRVRVKRYDAVFMKRFDATKGVFDVVKIWKEVLKARPTAKLGMVGLGTKDAMSKLYRLTEVCGAKNSIDYLGPIYDFDSKISLLASSKLLVLPSYEENWAIVIGEAMAAGVPVLCYDLPEIRSIWMDRVVWVLKGDRKAFARKILEMLDDEKATSELPEKGSSFMKRYDWREIAENEMAIIANAVRNCNVLKR